jgi:hypothetical protein
MSESTRALCQIIEARPFLTLTDKELSVLFWATGAQLGHVSEPVSQDLHRRLRDEMVHRQKSEAVMRPFLSLTDQDLEMMARALSAEGARCASDLVGNDCHRLASQVWSELKTRRRMPTRDLTEATEADPS